LVGGGKRGHWGGKRGRRGGGRACRGGKRGRGGRRAIVRVDNGLGAARPDRAGIGAIAGAHNPVIRPRGAGAEGGQAAGAVVAGAGGAGTRGIVGGGVSGGGRPVLQFLFKAMPMHVRPETVQQPVYWLVGQIPEGALVQV
jgi:hypothetical protein